MAHRGFCGQHFFSAAFQNTIFFLQTVDHFVCNYQLVFVHRVLFGTAEPQSTILCYLCLDWLIEKSIDFFYFAFMTILLARLKYFTRRPRVNAQNIVKKICQRFSSNSFMGFRANAIVKRRKQQSRVFYRVISAFPCSMVSGHR